MTSRVNAPHWSLRLQYVRTSHESRLKTDPVVDDKVSGVFQYGHDLKALR